MQKKTKCNMADVISHCKSTYGIGDFSTYGDTLNEKIREITGDKKKGNGDQSHVVSDASAGTPPKGAQGAAGPRGLKRKQVKKEPDVSVISLASSSQQSDGEAEQVTESDRGGGGDAGGSVGGGPAGGGPGPEHACEG